jgi:hypothetical protein
MNAPRKLTPLNFPLPTMPSGLPGKIWMVVRPSGECDFMRRPPLEGWAEWTHRLDARVVEYTFGVVIYAPAPKKTVPPKP